MPPADVLKKVRQEIDYNYVAFKKIVDSKKFKSVFGALTNGKEYTLSRPPKGYEADNPAIEFLKMKSFVAMVAIKDSELNSPELIKKITTAFETLQPLLNFMNEPLWAKD